MKALNKIHAHHAERAQDRFTLDVFRDGQSSHRMADIVDRCHHFSINGIFEHVLDESAVDLDVIDWQMLQIAERGHTGAKVIERELAAALLQLADEARGSRK